MSEQRRKITELLSTVFTYAVGACVAIGVALALHSDGLNGYPKFAQRIANCAARNTCCRLIYSLLVEGLSLVGCVVALLLLATTGAAFYAMQQSDAACELASSSLAPAADLLPKLTGEVDHLAGDLARVEPPTDLAGVVELGEDFLSTAKLAPLCAASGGLRTAAFASGTLCAQLASVGNIALAVFDPDGSRIGEALGQPTSMPALTREAREACYDLSMLVIAFDQICVAEPLPATYQRASRVQRARLERSAQSLGDEVRRLLATHGDLESLDAQGAALNRLIAQVGDALATATTQLLDGVQRVQLMLGEARRVVVGGVGEALCALFDKMEGMWVVALLGAALLLTAMVGCKLAAGWDVWHFYTLLPLGPLLAGAPTLARGCVVFGLLGGLAMSLPLLAAPAVLRKGLAGLAPVFAVLPPAFDVDVAGPSLLGLTALAAVGTAVACGVGAVAISRGLVAQRRLARYPVRMLSGPEHWVGFKLGQVGRSLLGNLTGCVGILVAIVVLIGAVVFVGVALGSSAACARLLESEAAGTLTPALHELTASATAAISAAEPSLDLANELAEGLLQRTPLAGAFEALHEQEVLASADYAPICDAVASQEGTVLSQLSCADVMPPVALVLYLMTLAGALPPSTDVDALQRRSGGLGVAAGGAGLGALYGGGGGGADTLALSGIAAEYSGATAGYYRAYGPLCQDVQAALRALRSVCSSAGTGTTGTADASDAARSTSAQLANASKVDFAESVLLVLADVDGLLSPITRPLTARGSPLRAAARLARGVTADSLRATVAEVDRLEVSAVLAPLCDAAETLTSLSFSVAAGALLLLLATGVGWYAFRRYTLFLDLVDFHAWQRERPSWDQPGVREAIRLGLERAKLDAAEALAPLSPWLSQARHVAAERAADARGALDGYYSKAASLNAADAVNHIKRATPRERVPGEAPAKGGKEML